MKKSEPEQRVLLVGAHQEISESMADLINEHYQVELLLVSADLNTFVKLQQKLPPLLDQTDVIILNLDGLDHIGIPLIQFIRAKSDLRIIIVNEYHSRSLANFMIENGATSYLPASSTSEEIERTIRRTLQGQSYIANKPT